MRHAVDWARNAILEHEVTALYDAQLLEAFLTSRSEAAFTAILRRHGPMVFAVCKRFLHDHHDAEDAFQAVFLVLAKRADTIRPAAQLANWLYGVAFKTASKTRLFLGKRRARERNNASLPEHSNFDRQVWSDFWLLFDQELNRLPDKYRAAIVLCDLEGRSRRDAAFALGILDGALSGRLSRGRKKLAARLSRRGITLSGAALAAAMIVQDSTAALPANLVAKTVNLSFTLAGQGLAATGGSAAIVSLTQGVIRSMFMAKLWQSSAVLVFSLLAIGAGASVMAVRGNSAGPAQVVARDEGQKGQEATGQTGTGLSSTQEELLRNRRATERANLIEIYKSLQQARKTEWDARWKQYLAGRGTLDFLLQSSSELLSSELNLAENPEDRQTAYKAHVARTYEVLKINKLRFEAGKVATQDLAQATGEYESARARLLTSMGKDPSTNPSPNPSTEKMNQLRTELLDAANQEWEARWEEYQAGRGIQTNLLASSRRLREAELKNAKNRGNESTAYRTHVERLIHIEKIAKERFDAGKITTQDFLEPRCARIEAELEYEQAAHR